MHLADSSDAQETIYFPRKFLFLYRDMVDQLGSLMDCARDQASKL